MMPIIRHRHTADYLVVPNSIFRDKRLSLRDIGLLCFMLSLPDEWSFSAQGLSCSVELDGLAAIKKSVKSIENAGYLRRTKKRASGGRMDGYIWEVSDAPLFCTVSPLVDSLSTEIPPMVLPPTETPSTENQLQYKYPSNKVQTKESTRKERVADKPPTRHRFVPPTVDEVRAYCAEKGYSVDPERFVDYYTSNGWRVGKNPMRDWKASVRTWVRKDNQNGRVEKSAGAAEKAWDDSFGNVI